MYISDYFKLPRGHANFEFIDIDTKSDTKLFIDPCLIEVGKDFFCQEALKVVNDYFDCFYSLYRNSSSTSEKSKLFQHAHEINATKLGYGNGNNGKAKTADGMIATFASLQELVDANIPVCKAIDLPIFIRDFAEDCLSDMLTNILFAQLSDFTLQQCDRYSIETQNINSDYFYWSIDTHSWEKYAGRGLVIDGNLVLLVPKNIVHSNYYYNVEQYFRSVILEKIQDEQTTYGKDKKAIKPTKKSLKDKLLSSNSDILDVSKKETRNEPELLNTHHRRMSSSYHARSLNDDSLDEKVYGMT